MVVLKTSIFQIKADHEFMKNLTILVEMSDKRNIEQQMHVLAKGGLIFDYCFIPDEKCLYEKIPAPNNSHCHISYRDLVIVQAGRSGIGYFNGFVKLDGLFLVGIR